MFRRRRFIQSAVYGGVTAADAAATTAFLARTSGLSGTEISAYKALINGLVSDGFNASTLAPLDCLYIFATNTTATALLNLCGTSFSLVSHGSMTFSADHGYTGDASTGFLDSQFTPSTAGGNWNVNSASQGAYILTNRTTAATKGATGAAVSLGGGFTLLGAYWSGNNVQYGSNGTNAGDVVANGAATAQGFWVQSRTGASANAIYRNGNTTPLATSSSVPTGNTDNSLYAFAINNTGIFLPTDDQMSAVFFGGGLTSTQMNNLSNRINAYMTALSINVY